MLRFQFVTIVVPHSGRSISESAAASVPFQRRQPGGWQPFRNVAIRTTVSLSRSCNRSVLVPSCVPQRFIASFGADGRTRRGYDLGFRRHSHHCIFGPVSIARYRLVFESGFWKTTRAVASTYQLFQDRSRPLALAEWIQAAFRLSREQCFPGNVEPI